MPAFDLEETAPAAVFHLLGGEMRKATAEAPLSPLWQDIYGFFDENSQWQKHLSLLKQGIGKTAKPERLSPKTAKALYGKNIFSSVSLSGTIRRLPLLLLRRIWSEGGGTAALSAQYPRFGVSVP